MGRCGTGHCDRARNLSDDVAESVMSYEYNSLHETSKWWGLIIMALVIALFVGAGMGWIT